MPLHPRSPHKCVQYSLSRAELGERRAATSITQMHETGEFVVVLRVFPIELECRGIETGF